MCAGHVQGGSGGAGGEGPGTQGSSLLQRGRVHTLRASGSHPACGPNTHAWTHARMRTCVRHRAQASRSTHHCRVAEALGPVYEEEAECDGHDEDAEGHELHQDQRLGPGRGAGELGESSCVPGSCHESEECTYRLYLQDTISPARPWATKKRLGGRVIGNKCFGWGWDDAVLHEKYK